MFGTPAYFYSCTGQLKVLFDRTVAIYPDLPNKQYYYLLAQGDESKDTFAGTILEEIQRVQFAKVCELLIKTKKPIAEIPRLTGFRTHSCLKTAFRKKFGISMAAYRKTQRTSPSA